MTDLPRVLITSKPTEVVRLEKSSRQFVDAPEPGTYRDPITGRLYRQRPRSEWWGKLLDRIRQ